MQRCISETAWHKIIQSLLFLKWATSNEMFDQYGLSWSVFPSPLPAVSLSSTETLWLGGVRQSGDPSAEPAKEKQAGLMWTMKDGLDKSHGLVGCGLVMTWWKRRVLNDTCSGRQMVRIAQRRFKSRNLKWDTLWINCPPDMWHWQRVGAGDHRRGGSRPLMIIFITDELSDYYFMQWNVERRQRTEFIMEKY